MCIFALVRPVFSVNERVAGAKIRLLIEAGDLGAQQGYHQLVKFSFLPEVLTNDACNSFSVCLVFKDLNEEALDLDCCSGLA